MAIERIATAYARLGGGISLVAGKNRLLTLSVVWNWSDVFQNSITVGGVAVPLLASGSNTAWAKIFGMFIPDAWSGLKTGSLVDGYGLPYYYWELFTGVDFANPVFDTASGGSGVGTSTSNSASIASKVNGRVMHCMGGGVPPYYAIANNTKLTSNDEGAFGIYTTPTAGNISVGWTFTGGRNGLAVLSLNPATASRQIIMM